MRGHHDDQPTQPNPIDQDAPPDRPSPKRARAPLYVLLASVALGLLVGVWLALRGTSLFSTSGNTATRPTIVIAAPTSPSPATATSPVPMTSPSPVVDEYTVESGDTLRSIAKKVYGDANLWPHLYDANRDVIGPDPDTLQSGMRLRIPPG